jgi:hypothetical protein
MARLYGASGVKGIDVKTESGTVRYDADKSGFINIENPRHAAQAKAEGMAEAAIMGASIKAVGYPCSCGFNSLFRLCSKCGKEN